MLWQGVEPWPQGQCLTKLQYGVGQSHRLGYLLRPQNAVLQQVHVNSCHRPTRRCPHDAAR